MQSHTHQADEADVVVLGRLPQLQVLPDEHADPDAAQVERVQKVVHWLFASVYGWT
jgi:hypothetical protein